MNTPSVLCALRSIFVSDMALNSYGSAVGSFLFRMTAMLSPSISTGTNSQSICVEEEAPIASARSHTAAPADDAVHEAALPSLPGHPDQLRDTAECRRYLASLPGGNEALAEAAQRTARFNRDVADSQMAAEDAAQELHRCVSDVVTTMCAAWPRSVLETGGEL